MPRINQDGPVWTLDLGAGENRFSPGWLDETERALDLLESTTDPAVLVTTATGKFFSNGLDLDWLAEHPGSRRAYLTRIEHLFRRVLTLPVPTVAAINGHAFGGGALLAMAHDHRVMREDRGFLCFPEVDIALPFTPGMSALVACKVTPRAALDCMTSGRRYPGPAAREAGLVDDTAPLPELRPSAETRVRDLAGKHRATLGTIKSRLFSDVVALLGHPHP